MSVNAMRIVILTGAGISAESGLSTFRDADGIWSRVRIEEVATPEAFRRDPERVREFYRERLFGHGGALPNLAHRSLARLEREFEGDVLVVTQNIDNLHELAGSTNVVHMHGEIHASLCDACGHRWRAAPAWHESSECPSCPEAMSRPDVVWFGEMPYEMPRIESALLECDRFVSIGTSGTVYPAAGFVALAAASGAKTLELNLEPSDGAPLFKEARHGPASEIVPAWVNELLPEKDRAN